MLDETVIERVGDGDACELEALFERYGITEVKPYEKYFVSFRKPENTDITALKAELAKLSQFGRAFPINVSGWFVLLNTLQIKYHSSAQVEKTEAHYNLERLCSSYFFELDCYAAQLTQRYPNAVFAAIGHSLKPLKWRLKGNSIPVTTFTVSNVSRNSNPTKAFNDYLWKKIEKMFFTNKSRNEKKLLVLIDYVDTGDTLLTIKSNIEALLSEHGIHDIQIIASGVSIGNRTIPGTELLVNHDQQMTFINDVHTRTLKLVTGRLKFRTYYNWGEHPTPSPNKDILAHYTACKLIFTIRARNSKSGDILQACSGKDKDRETGVPKP